MSVAELLDGRDICVCAGSGGVGKTTVAAAIGMGMAAEGLKVAVVTIDPAKRLANSLGVPELGNEAVQVDPNRFAAEGLEMRGELWAMMLDAKRTFDELVEKRAPDEQTRKAVLDNRIYKELSNAVAGSQEYMAMEKLWELHHDGDYDLIVLDTPPTRNALDFLDAPERLSKFLDSRSLQFFLAPGRRGLKLFGRGTGLVFSVLKRVTGVDLLQDLSSFFQSFGDMAEGFNERAAQVNELLADRRTSFILVTTPQADSVDEAVFFQERLAEREMPFGGAIVNRVHDDPGRDSGDDVEDELAGALGGDLGRKVARNYDDYRALGERDLHNIERLESEIEGRSLVLVPYLDDDVYDVRGLMRMNEHLFPAGAVSA